LANSDAPVEVYRSATSVTRSRVSSTLMTVLSTSSAGQKKPIRNADPAQDVKSTPATSAAFTASIRAYTKSRVTRTSCPTLAASSCCLLSRYLYSARITWRVIMPHNNGESLQMVQVQHTMTKASSTFPSSLPECVEELLELDLGSHTLAASPSSSVAHPSPVLRALYQITEQRKRWFCDECLPSSVSESRKGLQDSQCQCTLRNRFLDRWLCLRCYEVEESNLDATFADHKERCACGQKAGNKTCLWCWGEVTHAMLEFDAVSNGDAEEEVT
jgi:hypothetical protein